MTRQSAGTREATAIPEMGEGKRGTDGHIAYLLRQAAAGVRQRLEDSFAGSSVTVPQFTLMTMLRAYPGTPAATLARLTMLTPQTINVITSNLLKRGAIRRESSPEDRRAMHLYLTELGEELLADCKRAADRVEATLTEGLQPEEEALVRAWLVRIAVG